MKLIVGLGNPGEKYKNNRHNVGHVVVDELKAKSKKLKGVVVTKTGVFMNDSGEEIKKLVGRYSLDIDHLYVIHDDLDIPLGSFKIQLGKGPKDHKGLSSISQALSSNDYWHVRIGIENRAQRLEVSGEQYVLQDFTTKELKKLRTVIEEVVKDLTQRLIV